MRLIIDCDPGNGAPAADIDDGLALALAWATPTVKLDLITTVEGNVTASLGGRIATGLAELAGRDVTVVVSQELPVAEPTEHWRDLIEQRALGEEVSMRWQETRPVLGNEPTRIDAAGHIISTINYSGEPATLLAIGPLTTVAAAERRSPGVLARCEKVVVLGGAFTGPTGVRELNFALDPEAADVVLTSGANITLLPLDVSRTSWITLNDIDRLAQSSHPLISHLGRSSRAWVRWISETRQWPGANAHDLLAAAITLDPDIASVEEARVRIDLIPGPNRSRPIRIPLGPPETTPTIQLVTSFNSRRFRRLFTSRFAAFGTRNDPHEGERS